MMTPYCKRVAATRSGLLVTMFVFLLTACGGETPPDPSLASGQADYLRWCASCHGNAGEGKPPAFPPLAGSEWLMLPDQALALIVLHGLRGEIEVSGRTYRGYMPPMRHLSDEEVAIIIEYLLASWGQRQSTIDAEEVSRLRDSQPQTPIDGREGLMQRMGMQSEDAPLDGEQP